MKEQFYVDARVHKGQILYRGLQNGKRIQERVKYSPYLFLDNDQPTGYKTLDGKNVKKKLFNSIPQARQFIRDHEDLSGFKYYGLTNFEYVYLYDHFPGEIKFDRKQISIVGLDIECHHADGFPDPKFANQEVTLITLTKNGKAHMFGCKPYTPKKSNTTFYLCDNEAELLKEFLFIWNQLDIDIVTGWNIDGFDIPYLVNRIVNVLGEEQAKRLSPWNIIEGREVSGKFGSTKQVFDIYGITVLDYMDLYKKFSYKNQESFTLDHIAFVELGKQKLDYSEYGTLDRLHDLNWELYCDYNLVDAELVDQLDAKLGYINIVLTMAYLMKCNYQDTLKTVRPWDVCIHAYLMDKNIVIPQAPSYKNSRDLVGGAVKEVIPGLYEWVASFDIKSSYPHQIISTNISPETLVHKINETIDYENLTTFDVYQKHRQYAIDNNLSMAGNLTMYSRDKRGFFAEIMIDFFSRREAANIKLSELEKLYNQTKDKKLKNEISQLDGFQLAIKILINSFYGAIANAGSRWNSIDLAEAITSGGQLSVKWAIDVINNYLNKMLKTANVDYVIASDTDSAYIELKSLVKKLNLTDKNQITDAVVKFCDVHLHDQIKKGFVDLASLMNSYDPQIKMARENIADRAIWTAKKHYVMNVLDSKGIRYDKPKLKMVGIEAVKSTIPMICKQKIKDGIQIIMEQDNTTLLTFISDFRKEFRKLPFEQVAFPRGVNDLKKYSDKRDIYSKGCPLHVRASLLYNHLIDNYSLEKQYNKIQDSSKIKYSYLLLPNPIKENVIGSPGTLPTEFSLDKYIDYDTNFDKSFLAPLDSLCSVIGWRTDNSASLEDLFS